LVFLYELIIKGYYILSNWLKLIKLLLGMDKRWRIKALPYSRYDENKFSVIVNKRHARMEKNQKI
jgi:hypothetical protein